MAFKTMKLVTAGVVWITISAGTPAIAASIQNSFGLSNPQRTITFSELSFPRNTPITDEFASLGVEFSNGIFYNPEPTESPGGDFSLPNIESDRLGNFTLEGSPAPGQGPPPVTTNSLSIEFTQPQQKAAFAVVTFFTETTVFTALRNGSVVETFAATTERFSPNNFYGFTNIVFNEISIDLPGNDSSPLQIDNLQLQSVPEPTFLFAIGALGSGLILRTLQRRRSNYR